ncbi:hypothetical protein ACFYRL_33050 [Streptomyces goshikiensis]|uniref:hypothetical protein n=1 Tax=Streptomyces goshikiensis TaxID=1942 RepID=UPI00369C2E84
MVYDPPTKTGATPITVMRHPAARVAAAGLLILKVASQPRSVLGTAPFSRCGHGTDPFNPARPPGDRSEGG